MMLQTNLGNAMTIINNTAHSLAQSEALAGWAETRRLVLNAMKPNKQFRKHQVSSILLMMVMCWASQSSAQPTRAVAKEIALAPQHLVINSDSTMESTSMLDLAYNDLILLAQTKTPSSPTLITRPATVTQPNWTKGDVQIIKSINTRITVPLSGSGNYSWYNPNGGQPELLMRLSVDNVLRYDDKTSKATSAPRAFELAQTACMELDAIAGQAGAWGPECKIKEFIIQPKGKLSPPTWKGADTSPSSGNFMYTPRKMGSSQDRLSFILENGAGKTVHVIIELNMVKWAPEGKLDYPIQTVEDEGNFNDITSLSDNQYGVLSNTYPNLTYTFTNLPGTAVGETTGVGAAANILLDINAAGRGWFMDSTPLSNDEYLPTSNPNEWIAKAGGAAADKMDLLSVLLHEYGHALGFEHSSDPHDFMGTSLTAGVRRLPTADEMQLMANLIGEIRAQNQRHSALDAESRTGFDEIAGLVRNDRLYSSRRLG